MFSLIKKAFGVIVFQKVRNGSGVGADKDHLTGSQQELLTSSHTC